MICFFLFFFVFSQFKFLITPVNFKGINKVADSFSGLFVHTSIMWPVGEYAPGGYLSNHMVNLFHSVGLLSSKTLSIVYLYVSKHVNSV